MQRVFRLRTYYRNLGVVCLLFFTAMAWLSFFATPVVPPDRRLFGMLMYGFWAIMAGLAGWVLLAYWRERLWVRDRQVVHRGVIGRRAIDLADVTAAQWKHAPRGGQVILRSRASKLEIHFENFEPDERLWLVEHFRAHIREDVQRDWGLFCYRVALPLSKYDPHRPRQPGPGEAVVTRRRWDRYFIPGILVAGLIGAACGVAFREPWMLLAPLPLSAIWLYVRFTTPRRGLVSPRIGAEPGETRANLVLLFWGVIGLAGVLLFQILEPRIPNAKIVGMVAMVCWFGWFVWRAHRLDRRRRQRDREAAKLIAPQWDERQVP